MAAPMVAPLPPNFSLESGMVIRLTALDEFTGAVVAGVVISQVSIDVDLPEDTTGEPLDTFTDPGSPFYFGDVAA